MTLADVARLSAALALLPVFSDGDVLVRNNINVCEVGTYRYHE